MAEKDFKEQNNYREVECCGNCRWRIIDSRMCIAYDSMENMGIKLCNTCDKWEHE